jgi:hypothetical protein
MSQQQEVDLIVKKVKINMFGNDPNAHITQFIIHIQLQTNNSDNPYVSF